MAYQPSKEEMKEYYLGRAEYLKGASRYLRDCKYELMEKSKMLIPCKCVTKGMTEEQRQIVCQLLICVMNIAIDTIEEYIEKTENEEAENNERLKEIE